MLPEPQEQVGLDGLSADITRARRDDGDLLTLLVRGLGAALMRWAFAAFLFEKSEVEIFVAAAHTIKTEVFFHEAAGVAALVLAKMGVGKKAMDRICEVVFISRGDECSALVVH